MEPDTRDETMAIPTPPASQSGNTSVKPKRPQKKVKHAEYSAYQSVCFPICLFILTPAVPIKVVPQLPWKLQFSVKEAAAEPNPMFVHQSPYVWAEVSN